MLFSLENFRLSSLVSRVIPIFTIDEITSRMYSWTPERGQVLAL